MANRGILVVVSGFSGAGKGTLMKHLLEKYDNYALSISATTRAPREGEEHGREYFFHTKQEFEELILQDALIEYAQYVENYYGTPKAYVEKQLEAGKDVILEIEIQGALKVKEKFPDTLLLFVTPPSAEELKRRLINRGTETKEVIDYRKNNRRSRRICERRMNMIHPSYTELMQAINEGVDVEDEPIVTSRYSIVLATSKRARQLIEGKEAMVSTRGKKPLSTAVEEFYKGLVKIVPDENTEEVVEETTEEE